MEDRKEGDRADTGIEISAGAEVQDDLWVWRQREAVRNGKIKQVEGVAGEIVYDSGSAERERRVRTKLKIVEVNSEERTVEGVVLPRPRRREKHGMQGKMLGRSGLFKQAGVEMEQVESIEAGTGVDVKAGWVEQARKVAQAGVGKVGGTVCFSSRRAEPRPVKQVLQVVEIGGVRGKQHVSEESCKGGHKGEAGAEKCDKLSAAKSSKAVFRSDGGGELQAGNAIDQRGCVGVKIGEVVEGVVMEEVIWAMCRLRLMGQWMGHLENSIGAAVLYRIVMKKLVVGFWQQGWKKLKKKQIEKTGCRLKKKQTAGGAQSAGAWVWEEYFTARGSGIRRVWKKGN